MGRGVGCHVGHEVGYHVGHDVGCHVGHDVPFCWLRKYSDFALGDVGHGVGCHIGHEVGCRGTCGGMSCGT